MQIRRDFLRSLEAAIIGVLFIQTVRYLYTALFADVSSADLVRRIADTNRLVNLPGYVEPASVQTEIYAVLAVCLAPLLGLIGTRTRWSIPLAVTITAIARYLTIELPDSSVLAAAVVVAGGLMYLTILIVRRPRFFPIFIALAVGGDQLIRALNATADPTFDPQYSFLAFSIEISITTALFALAIFALLLTLLTTIVEREESRLPNYQKQPDGVLGGWSALALGGILFLELTLLGLPNAAAHWAKVDYYVMLPMLFMATTLPLVPEVRAQAGNFAALFDGTYRGWLWALLLALCIVIGKRFEGLTAGVMLALAQFLAILTLWWLVKQPEKSPRVNPTPVLVLFSVVIFLLLSAGDYFTYDYAYVRPLAAPFGFISDLLTGMKEMGLPLALVAVILTCLPMILERQLIPWRQGRLTETLLTLGLVVASTIYSTNAAVPAAVRRPLVPDCLRIASYNIHGGYTQLFAPNLELVAQTIEKSGADIVLLQEVETGILRSGSTDQALWLAHRLNMNSAFYPQNEELQGLAILSRLDVVNATGALLTSSTSQGVVQYVQYALDDQGELHIYNVWLSLLVRGEDGQPLPQPAQDQTVQVQEVERLIAANHFDPRTSGTDRVVLGGTFNHDERSPLYQTWAQTIFDDPFVGLFNEDRYTLRTVDNIPVRYDYLWLLNLTPSGINIDQSSLASDHYLSLVAVGRESGRGCPAN